MSKVRTRENASFWNKKITDLFRQAPRAQLTEHRHQATRAVLLGIYPWIADIDKVKFIEMLGNATYVERRMRYLTEGQQVDIKKRLSEEAQVQLHFR